jgi:single-stranded DNA-specific DHH superfamily exonuclease
VQFSLETQKLRVDRWPHWKSKSMSYESTKILGKMYTRVTEKLEFLLQKRNKQTELSVPEKIKNLLFDYDDEFSKEKVAKQIKDFIKERAKIKFSIEDDEVTAEYRFEWQSKYLANKRKAFCYDKKNPGKVALVDAAIIYEQCLALENTDSSSDACDFAWGVCREELLEIFSGKNRISVSCEAQSFALR